MSDSAHQWFWLGSVEMCKKEGMTIKKRKRKKKEEVNISIKKSKWRWWVAWNGRR